MRHHVRARFELHWPCLRCGAREGASVGEEGVVGGGQRPCEALSSQHAQRARREDEHGVAGIALSEEHLSRLEANRPKEVRQLARVAERHVREGRDHRNDGGARKKLGPGPKGAGAVGQVLLGIRLHRVSTHQQTVGSLARHSAGRVRQPAHRVGRVFVLSRRVAGRWGAFHARRRQPRHHRLRRAGLAPIRVSDGLRFIHLGHRSATTKDSTAMFLRH
mmetsp:Transcript_2925/g.8959  ORF Transcript_2925/g.8959 Transcript_2925/m.8959 type:complete len:219 (+) Transcript_2925:1112-1768(+)